MPRPDVVIDDWGRFVYPGLMTAGDAPLAIFHGTNDTIVDYTFAQDLAAEAGGAGISYSFYSITGGGHSFIDLPIQSITLNGTSLYDISVNFIDAHLKAGTPLYETRDVPVSGN